MIFAQYGLPEATVSANESSFVSDEFKTFLMSNGIAHVVSSPYHPVTNGLAEKAVQIFKNGLKKIAHGSLSKRLSKFLFNYLLTPQSTTGLSPAELLCGRKLKSRLDLLKLNLGNRMRLKIAAQGRYHNTHTKHHSFQSGDLVYAKGGLVDMTLGYPESYCVRLVQCPTKSNWKEET